MGHTVHYIKDTGHFLPTYKERFKGLLSYIFGTVNKDPNNYTPPQDMDVRHSLIRDDDIEYKCSHYEAPNARRALFVLGGLRSTAKGKNEIFDVARRAGISVIMAELPCGEEDADLDLIEKMSKSFLLNTPFYEQYEGRPRYLMGHSTGGYCITKALWEDEDQAKKILDKFTCIKMFGAFFQASYMSSTIQKLAYPVHAWMNLNREYGQALGDKFHTALNITKGNPYVPPTKGNPYPRHSEVWDFGSRIEIKRKEILSRSFPPCVRQSEKIEFIHGEYDNVAVPKAAQKIAHHMKAKFTRMENTFHNPYTPERVGAILYHIFNPSQIKRRRNVLKALNPTSAFTAYAPSMPLILRARPKKEITRQASEPNLPILINS